MPPEDLLAEHDEITMVTVDSPREGLGDLATGKAGSAILRGPSVGWVDSTNRSESYRVVPPADSNMRWHTVIAFAKDQIKLRDAVDRIIDGLGGVITSLREKYGFPKAPLIRLTRVRTEESGGTPGGAVVLPGGKAAAGLAGSN